MNQTPQPRHKLLFSGAIGFYEAARSLHQVTGELHWPAFFVLMSYAAELSVKAFMMFKTPDATERMLQNDIGHNLDKGFQMAVKAGYDPPNNVTVEMFHMLNKHHVNHSARYLNGPPVEMKPHEIMLAAMAHFLTTIGTQMSIPVKLEVPNYKSAAAPAAS